jgi:hypothetical protein
MECAVEVGNGIACRNKCEAQVTAINDMIERGKKSEQVIAESRGRIAESRKQTAGTLFGTAIFIGLLGAFFAIKGVISWSNGNEWNSSIVIGIIFLIGAFSTSFNALKHRRNL